MIPYQLSEITCHMLKYIAEKKKLCHVYSNPFTHEADVMYNLNFTCSGHFPSKSCSWWHFTTLTFITWNVLKNNFLPSFVSFYFFQAPQIIITIYPINRLIFGKNVYLLSNQRDVVVTAFKFNLPKRFQIIDLRCREIKSTYLGSRCIILKHLKQVQYTPGEQIPMVL